MGNGSTSFWKVFFGVLAGLFVAGSCAVGACVLLLGRAAQDVQQRLDRQKQEQRAYVSKVTAEVTEFADRDPFASVRGNVKNRGQKVVTYWSVTVRFLDRDGNVVDTERTLSVFERLRPGEAKQFQVMRPNNPSFARVTATVEEVRTE